MGAIWVLANLVLAVPESSESRPTNSGLPDTIATALPTGTGIPCSNQIGQSWESDQPIALANTDSTTNVPTLVC